MENGKWKMENEEGEVRSQKSEIRNQKSEYNLIIISLIILHIFHFPLSIFH